jgi:hypothetical protein
LGRRPILGDHIPIAADVQVTRVSFERGKEEADLRNVKALGELLREIEVKPAEQPRKSSPVSD